MPPVGILFQAAVLGVLRQAAAEVYKRAEDRAGGGKASQRTDDGRRGRRIARLLGRFVFFEVLQKGDRTVSQRGNVSGLLSLAIGGAADCPVVLVRGYRRYICKHSLHIFPYPRIFFFLLLLYPGLCDIMLSNKRCAVSGVLSRR